MLWQVVFLTYRFPLSDRQIVANDLDVEYDMLPSILSTPMSHVISEINVCEVVLPVSND